MKSVRIVSINLCDVHYGSNNVDGSKILELFGDMAMELLIRNDGDEDHLRTYDKTVFLTLVHLEITL